MAIKQRILAAGVAFLVAFFATFALRAVAVKLGMLDFPSSRSSHSAPMARGGGLAVAIAFIVTLQMIHSSGKIDFDLYLALVIGGCLIAVLSCVDDRWPLDPGLRFCFHLIAAVLAVTLIGDAVLPGWLRLAGAGLWIVRIGGILGIVWTINLFNFMDGIDGIAGTEAIFVCGAGAWLTSRFGGSAGLTDAMTCLGAATLGFLFWNWPPAKIFLGDVGSTFLGFSLAVLGWAASLRAAIPIEVWIILGGVFIVDATCTLLRRMLRGDSWSQPHRIHAYQHMARLWGSHRPVTVWVLAVDVCWLLPMAWIAADQPSWADAVMCAALLPLVGIAFICGSGRPER